MKLAKLAVAVCVAVSSSAVQPALGANSPVEQLKGWLAQPREGRPALGDQPFATAPLTKADAAAAQGMLWADHVADVKATRQQEWDDKAIPADGQVLKLLVKSFGTKPAGGWNLFISMHGGGGAPAALNDSQWANQIRLYQPDDSIVIAPRAPTNDWDLWHKKEIDDLFTRLVADAIVLADVDPNRVYCMGYSAGGNGAFELAPRMADHWAAATAMAGHPNDASPLSLRDLPFAIHTGALDGGKQGYHRNEKATEWDHKLGDLEKADPQGYVHVVKLHQGLGHWMNLEDAEALPWMLQYTRNPLPDKVVWMQNGVTHDRFYWLATPADQAKAKQLAVVSHQGQAFDVQKVAGGLRTLTVMMNDKLVDLDQPVTITMDGKPLFTGQARRTIANLDRTLEERGDPDDVFAATETVTVGA